MTSRLEEEHGFTLVEILIVLFTIASVTSIVFVSFQSLYHKKQTTYFLEQLRNDLYLTQQYAISHNLPVCLTFNHSKHRYLVKTCPKLAHSAFRLIEERQYNEHFQISVHFSRSIDHIQYNPNGHISGFGHVTVKTPYATYKVVFHIGEGRFYVEKS